MNMKHMELEFCQKTCCAHGNGSSPAPHYLKDFRSKNHPKRTEDSENQIPRKTEQPVQTNVSK